MTTARAALAAVLLAGCATTSPPPPSSSLIGAWVVSDIGGAGVVGRAPLTVEFDETSRVSGSSGCNRYTGAYSYDAVSGALTMTPLGVTRRACLDPALNAQEQAMIAALEGARRTETLDGGAVALVSDTGRLTMRRGRTAPAAPAAAAPTASIATEAATPVANGAPLSPIRAAPPSTSSYPLAGGPSATPAVAPAVTPAPQPVATPAAAAPPPVPVSVPPPVTVASPSASTRITVSGTIVPADGAAVPADAIVRVQLRDVGRVDAPATVLGQQEIPALNGPPWTFEVTAPQSVIRPNARLTVFAQVLAGERLLQISDTSNPAPLGGASGMTVRLANAARGPAPAAIRPPVAPASAAPASPTITPEPYVARPAPPPALTEIPGSTPWRCRTETFRLAFEEGVAFLTTADGAVARLARIDASDDTGAPRMYSNSILTVIRDPAGGVRFARGRAALTTCTPG
jgi:heat shock protein HslJ